MELKTPKLLENIKAIVGRLMWWKQSDLHINKLMNIRAILMIVTEHLVWRNKCLLYTKYSFNIQGNFILLCCTENNTGSNTHFKEIVDFVKSLLTLWGVATFSGNILGSWRIWEASASMKIFSFWNAEHLALTHRHFIAVRESGW